MPRQNVVRDKKYAWPVSSAVILNNRLADASYSYNDRSSAIDSIEVIRRTIKRGVLDLNATIR
jgi:hypothetical protein